MYSKGKKVVLEAYLVIIKKGKSYEPILVRASTSNYIKFNFKFINMIINF